MVGSSTGSALDAEDQARSPRRRHGRRREHREHVPPLSRRCEQRKKTGVLQGGGGGVACHSRCSHIPFSHHVEGENSQVDDVTSTTARLPKKANSATMLP